MTSDASMPRTPAGDDAAPTVIDTTRPSIARVYDCFLGGKDNYDVDREVFQQVDAVAPQMKQLARDHRRWLIRVVRFLAGHAGIEQFLDCGAGLPTAENTHQIAQRVNLDARVVYVDNEPTVAAHGRAILEENDGTHLVEADLTRPDEVFGHPTVARSLDLERPLALIQCSTIHHVPDAAQPLEIMRRYVDLLPSGSYLALTHFYDPQDGSEVSALARFVEGVFAGGDLGSGYFRSRSEIESFFGGLELIEPGIVRLNDWWPDGPRQKPLGPEDGVLIGGVARKS